jgi:hypothetical protein
MNVSESRGIPSLPDVRAVTLFVQMHTASSKRTRRREEGKPLTDVLLRPSLKKWIYAERAGRL